MQEVVVDLNLVESTQTHFVPRPAWPSGASEVTVVLKVNPREVRHSCGMVTIGDGIPNASDMARAYDAALPPERAGEELLTLVLPGVELSLNDWVSGFGLPPGLPARQLTVTIPFLMVRSDAFAVLTDSALIGGCRIVGVRVEVDRGKHAALPPPGTSAMRPEDFASLALWLDGMAKFIDITKARLPDLPDGRTIMMQRLSRHTMELKKRVQEFVTPSASQ